MTPQGKPQDRASQAAGPAERAGALAVHLFTASGALLGFLALLAADRGAFAAMFGWLGVALVVDGIDGSIARKMKVGTALPRFSGEALDLVVDFVTYVLVPVYALVKAGLLAPGFDIVGAGLICVSSALYFADTKMKTDDWYFRGFPAVWNAVIFYLFLLAPPPWACFAIIAILSAVTFAPIAFVHPFRVEQRRLLTLVLLAAWAVLATIAILDDLQPPLAVTIGLVMIAVYFFAAGLLRPRGLTT